MNSLRDRTESAKRLAIVELRHRIELIMVTAVKDSFTTKAVLVKQEVIKPRLAFVGVAYDGRTSLEDIVRLIRTARHIYTRSSDVLHGRTSMTNIAGPLIDEWAHTVDELESLALKADDASQP
ncbi:hypothetical protein [Clavibacter sp. VKM Ac-2872]|uniref:hypothetical protein n=1 Tax=Clavibacter sp. VKM Ac-2872 TaxID=2783812 RepID=UPI00188B50DE|nr:hypothetical protein [Clavibacter sp. VKM Ac-2872]MBF4623311.1 hypothetical protein [Clavibacter sp. VKM Ac-2872]